MTTQQAEETQGQLLSDDDVSPDVSGELSDSEGDEGEALSIRAPDREQPQPTETPPPNAGEPPSSPSYESGSRSQLEEQVRYQRQQIEYGQQQMAALQAQYEQQAAERALQERMAQWEDAGFMPDQVQTLAGEARSIEAERARLKQANVDMERRFNDATQEQESRIVVAQILASQYKVPFNDLLGQPSPELMEMKADLMATKAENSKLKQGTVAPGKVDSGYAPSAGSSNRNRQMDALMNKPGAWTDADHATYNKLMEQGR